MKNPVNSVEAARLWSIRTGRNFRKLAFSPKPVLHLALPECMNLVTQSEISSLLTAPEASFPLRQW